MTKITEISLDKFVNEVMGGERKFRIKLPYMSDLSNHEGFPEFNNYLKGADLELNPMDISGSEFIGLKAVDLYLPHTLAYETNFHGARLNGADLNGAHLDLATLKWAHLDWGTS